MEPPVENPGENPGENPVENPSCLTGPEVQGPLVALDDRQLCRLWRQSFWELRDARLPENRLRLVLLRQACLDELIRRHGQGVEAWLHSGARASSGPDKFLGGHGAA